MGKEEFLKKAREMGMTETLINEIVKEVEEDIALCIIGFFCYHFAVFHQLEAKLTSL